MPDQDSETFFDEPEKSDNSAEEVEQSTDQEEEETSENSEKLNAEVEQSFLKGTKFKKGEDLLKAYNELQSEFTRRSQELSESKEFIQKNVIPLLTKEQKQDIKDDPDAFLKAFVADPKGTLFSLISETSKSIVEPLQGEVRGMGANLELQSFLQKHPELIEEDVESFMKVMDAFPEMRSRKDRLEVWLKLLKDERPEIGQRTTMQKQTLEQGVSDAKKAATLGGKKSSTPRQESGDEFDEILRMYSERQGKFKY